MRAKKYSLTLADDQFETRRPDLFVKRWSLETLQHRRIPDRDFPVLLGSLFSDVTQRRAHCYADNSEIHWIRERKDEIQIRIHYKFEQVENHRIKLNQQLVYLAAFKNLHNIRNHDCVISQKFRWFFNLRYCYYYYYYHYYHYCVIILNI